MINFFFVILTILGVPMGLYFVASYLKIHLDSLKQKHNLVNHDDQSSSTQKKIEYLMNENEEMKEELRNIKYLLSRETKRERIDFDYEKEQMKLDYDSNDSISLDI